MFTYQVVMATGTEMVRIQWHLHGHEIMKRLQQAYLTDTFSDVSLLMVDGNTIPANKLVLSSSSKYFKVCIYCLFQNILLQNSYSYDPSVYGFQSFFHKKKFPQNIIEICKDEKPGILIDFISNATLYQILELMYKVQLWRAKNIKLLLPAKN